MTASPRHHFVGWGDQPGASLEAPGFFNGLFHFSNETRHHAKVYRNEKEHEISVAPEISRLQEGMHVALC